MLGADALSALLRRQAAAEAAGGAAATHFAELLALLAGGDGPAVVRLHMLCKTRPALHVLNET